MAANMYARSIFGEDVLANLSIEKPLHLGKDATVQGHVRIRAKSQVCASLFCFYVIVVVQNCLSSSCKVELCELRFLFC